MVVVCLQYLLHARFLTQIDPSPLKSLASSLRRTQSERHKPSLKQTSPLSDLQKLVRDGRATIIDPVLPAYAFLNEPDSEPDEPPDPEEIRRALEREKIRELKQRRIDSDAVVPVVAGLRRPASALHGVFIRRDQADESADVDIGMDNSAPCPSDITPSSAQESQIEVSTSPTSIASVSIINDDKASVRVNNKSTRAKRSTRKVDPPSAMPEASSSKNIIESPVQDDEPKLTKKGKPRPETYKQAWSVEEQHILERLLDEIPEGSKNR